MRDFHIYKFGKNKWLINRWWFPVWTAMTNKEYTYFVTPDPDVLFEIKLQEAKEQWAKREIIRIEGEMWEL